MLHLHLLVISWHCRSMNCIVGVTPIGRIRGIPAFDSVRRTRFVSARCILDIFSLAVSTLFFFTIPRRILPHLNVFLHLLWLLLLRPQHHLSPFDQRKSSSTGLIRNDCGFCTQIVYFL